VERDIARLAVFGVSACSVGHTSNRIGALKAKERYLELNRVSWSVRTDIDIASVFYDREGLLKGNSSLQSIEESLLGDVMHPGNTKYNIWTAKSRWSIPSKPKSGSALHSP